MEYSRVGKMVISLLFILISLVALYHMLGIFYTALVHESFDLNLYAVVFTRLWYYWVPSTLLLLIFVDKFITAYLEKNQFNVRKAYDEFWNDV